MRGMEALRGSWSRLSYHTGAVASLPPRNAFDTSAPPIHTESVRPSACQSSRLRGSIMRRTILALSLTLFLIPLVAAQDTDFREELRFAEALRARGDNDLALEIIQKLRKTAPADLAKELPLEEAKTRLRGAGDEPETARRLRQYREARTDFQKFIDSNPGHPRIAEANLDIARLLNLIGRTELNQALLSDDSKTKNELARQSRATLVEAAGKLAAAALELEKQLAAADDPESISDPAKKKEAIARRSQLEREIDQTKVERGLNLYDQSSTYLGG